MFNHLDRKEPTNNTSSPEIKSGNTVFSPLSPFSANNSNETEYSLPDWILVEDEQIKSQAPNIYDFDWLQDNNVAHNDLPVIAGTSNIVDNSEALPSLNKHDDSDSNKSRKESNKYNEVTDILTNNESDPSYEATVKSTLVEVGNPTEILNNARNM